MIVSRNRAGPCARLWVTPRDQQTYSAKHPLPFEG